MFPVLKNKQFTDLVDGKVVTVSDQFENIAILDNGQRIDVKRLLDPAYFDEYIDPRNFFGDTYNIFAEKIKSVDLSQIKDEEPVNDSAIIEVDPAQERREMEERARQMAQQMNPNSAVQKQVELLKEILGEDEDLPVIESVPVTQVTVNEKPQVQTTKQVVQPKADDPIITMFKNVKRNKDFSFNFTIEGKIPRVDFIEMMEDSYETSIIEFLAQEFTQNLISNPEMIKARIVQEIKSIVYPNGSDSNEAPLEIITDVASQSLEPINDGSTNLKPKKAPRKSPSTKKKTDTAK